MKSVGLFKIRQASIMDAKAIIHLVELGLEEFGFKIDFNTSESDIVNIDEDYNSNGGLFLVAEDVKKRIVGTGGILKITNVRYKIKKMYVVKEFRGQGIGKEILTRLEEFALKNEAKELVLETTGLMGAAINLYKNFGFKEVADVMTSPRCEFSMKKDII